MVRYIRRCKNPPASPIILIFWKNCIESNQMAPFLSKGVKILLPLLSLPHFWEKIVWNEIKWPLFFIKRGKNPPSSPIIVSFFGKNVPNHIKWPLFLWGENPPASPIIIIFWKKLYRIKSKGVKATCPSSPPLEQPLRALDCAELLSTRPPCCLPEIVYACLYYSLN